MMQIRRDLLRVRCAVAARLKMYRHGHTQLTEDEAMIDQPFRVLSCSWPAPPRPARQPLLNVGAGMGRPEERSTVGARRRQPRGHGC